MGNISNVEIDGVNGYDLGKSISAWYVGAEITGHVENLEMFFQDCYHAGNWQQGWSYTVTASPNVITKSLAVLQPTIDPNDIYNIDIGGMLVYDYCNEATHTLDTSIVGSNVLEWWWDRDKSGWNGPRKPHKGN